MHGTRKEPGASPFAGGTRFTLFSRHADSVELCLFDGEDEPETRRISLSSDGDGTWSALAEGVRPGQLYGYRVHGPFDPPRGHRFNPAKLLVDPRALAITGEPPLDTAFLGARIDDESRRDDRDTSRVAPKSIVVDRRFDWGDDRPPATPWDESVIYECHVRGMTMRHPEVPTELRGTYLGLAAEPVLDHLSNLGITAVELLPVHQIASEPHVLESGLRNYFGYSPLGFFAPHAGYARESGGGQVTEFKQMVRALHERNIEVILDVVFNHTAEGDHRGRTLSLRGIDNRTYYRLNRNDLRLYEDSTGCGNSIAADHPAVVEFLVDCLRYWVDEMHVDGFRFDLAVTLGRTGESFTPRAPFFEAVARDPVLSGVKLIAEPWDLGPNGYQRSAFPPGWIEWNDLFRDSVRSIWRSDGPGKLDILRTLDGDDRSSSADPVRKRTAVHFVTCHDGFTLEDLVSYEHKHNWSNGEENRDGSNNNLSCNWGVEGPTEDPEIRRRRRQAKRNLLATALLSKGVPMLLHGDELDRTQKGNNNTYCQDNELTWLDWRSLQKDTELSTLVSSLAAVRKRISPLLLDRRGRQRWLTYDGRHFAGRLDEASSETVGLYLAGGDGLFVLLFNPESRDRLVRLPRQTRPGCWRRLLSTVETGSRELTAATYRQSARSVAVLEFVSAPPEDSTRAS